MTSRAYHPIVCLVLLLLGSSAAVASADKDANVARDEIYNTVQTLIADKDLFAASEYVLGLGDEATIAKAFDELLFDVHEKATSTEQVIHFAHAGIHYCLARAVANDEADAAAARTLRLTAKRMATNAASFTWPGWDEAGVTISPEQMRQGLAFARYSMRQLHELDPTDAQLGFSYWFLGAQLLANETYGEALYIFGEAREYDRRAGNADSALMNSGYIGLTRILDGEAQAGEAEFNAAVKDLRARNNEDATFFAEQLLSVRAVFERK